MALASRHPRPDRHRSHLHPTHPRGIDASTRHSSDLVHRPASVLAILLVVQFALGILTVLTRKPADLATAHVAVGALVLLSTFIITVRAMRIGNHQSQAAAAEA